MIAALATLLVFQLVGEALVVALHLAHQLCYWLIFWNHNSRSDQ